MTAKAVCLISGGIDSCVSASLAKTDGFEIYGLSFDYGQQHKKELEKAKKIAISLQAKRHVVMNIDLQKFGGSSLLDGSHDIPHNHELEDIGKSIPSTYVPGRNTVFLSIGLAYAEAIDADAVFIGATATDYAGYPDCRPEYIDAFQKMANLATKRGINGKPIQIKAPLLNLSKADIIKKGVENGAPLDDTWSCYQGGEKPCGRCDSCLLRLKGFKEAQINDPLGYNFLPEWYKK